MQSTFAFDPAAEEWRIRVAKVFDFEEAKACTRCFRGFHGDRLSSLVFDLSATRRLHTAGLGAMLFLRGCCEVPDTHAHIVYNDPNVGMILRLTRLERWFTLLPQGAAQAEDKILLSQEVAKPPSDALTCPPGAGAPLGLAIPCAGILGDSP